MNVDGADFKIQNQNPFSKSWYSHKFNGPALRYELASCIQTGDIVWMNGPFKPGTWNDIAIFCVGLKNKLEDANEKAEADLGYRGEPNTVRHPYVFISKSDIKAKKMSRGRHETINRRMKQFNCLSQTFRHNVNNHQDVFQAVAVITQISFDCGEKPWQCTY